MENYTFDHVRLRPEEQIGVHTQQTWELSYVICGSGTRELGGMHRAFTSGDLVLIPPGIAHGWQFVPQDTDAQGRIENITLHFATTLLDNLAEALPVLENVRDRILSFAGPVCFGTKERERLSILLKRMSLETDERRAVTLVDVLCTLSGGLPMDYALPPDPTREKLMKARIFVSCNYRRAIPIDEIADVVGMNRTAFCKFFRKQTGQSFVQYLNAYRLGLARQWLEAGTMSVTEACFACGFNDVAYFCRAFRRQAGFPPSKARTEAR